MALREDLEGEEELEIVREELGMIREALEMPGMVRERG